MNAPDDRLRLRPGVSVPDELKRDAIVRRLSQSRAVVVALRRDLLAWNAANPDKPQLDTKLEDEMLAWLDGKGPLPREVRERIGR